MDSDTGLQGLAIDLLRQLGSHSITVAQLKKIFRLMQPLPAESADAVDANEVLASPGSASQHQPPGHASVAPSKATSSAPVAGSKGGVSVSTSSAPLQPPWLCGLLRAVRGMMEDRPGPQRFFLLNGISSGLRLPPMPRWPAPKGYTFCAWVRLDAASPSSRSVARNSAPRSRGASDVGAPCLFSFCGERGQSVAACFIPLGKGLGRERRAGEAASATTGAQASSSARTSAPPCTEEPQRYALEMRVGAGHKKSPTVIRFPGISVRAGKWVFVAVAHAPNGWAQRGEAAVLVDNCWKVVASPFPRFRDGGVPSAAVACHCPVVEGEDAAEIGCAGAKVPERPTLCSLRGQVGMIMEENRRMMAMVFFQRSF